MADTDGRRLSQQPQRDRESVARIESSLGDDPVGCDQDVADADGQRRGEGPGQLSWLGPAERDWWSVEPDVGRVAHGVPARVDRLRALGNAVVPQVAEHVGRLILDAHLVAEVTG
jgi:DNA (cytosine-5)-methyltransferase 1